MLPASGKGKAWPGGLWLRYTVAASCQLAVRALAG